MLNKIQTKIDRLLYELFFVDAFYHDEVNVVTTVSCDNLKNLHHIKLASGKFNGKNIEGQDTDGHNIHLPKEFIVDIN